MKKGNAERILNDEDAMLITFSLGTKSNGYGTKEATLLVTWSNLTTAIHR